MIHTTPYESIVLMGKIASGKGTQASEIVQNFGGTLYSNGNKVRETVQLPTVFGRKIKDFYEGGYLIPEWVASYWMTHALVSQFVDERVVFEAVAKKPDEAVLFHQIHDMLERPYIVFNLEISDDTVRQRSAERSRDVVDSVQSVEKRLEEYRTHTAKSIEFFREQGKVVDVDGSAAPGVVQDIVFSHLMNR